MGNKTGKTWRLTSAFHFARLFVHKFQHERIFRQSASLTFITLLGFVPFLIFLLFFLPNLSFLHLETHFVHALKGVFLPESAAQISEYIEDLAERKIQFNLFSFVILLLSSYSLFRVIKDSFDHILNAHYEQKHSLLRDVSQFFGMSILGSILILIILSATSQPLLFHLFGSPLLRGVSLFFTPFLLLFFVFTLGFFFIPSAKVKSRSIIAAAALTSITWMMFKSLFDWYVLHLTNIELIFGFLASIPVFLFWIYCNWIIVLSGVILVALLEARVEHALPQSPDIMRVTIEWAGPGKPLQEINSGKILRDDLAAVLKEVLTDEKTEAAVPPPEKEPNR